MIRPTSPSVALAKRVLQAQALPVGQDLVRAGLADVDHRLAVEMARGDEIAAHRSPPATPPRGRGPRRGAWWRGGAARRRGARQAFALGLPQAGGEILDRLGGQLGL